MKYVNDRGGINLALHGICPHTDINVAKAIAEEIIDFWNKNPQMKISLHFGGTPRLSEEFFDEFIGTLANDPKWGSTYADKILAYDLHMLDMLTGHQIFSEK